MTSFTLMPHSPRLAYRAKTFVATVAALCAALGLLGASAAQAQSGNAGQALNFLQSVLGAGQAPGQQAAPAGTAGWAGNVLGAALAPGAVASGDDLVQMLSQSLDQIDEPREIQIGQQLAAVLLGSKPLLADAALQRYVNQLGRWLSLQSSRPQLPWTFAVLDDPGYNAFAAPGGFVFVTKGLVDRVADEGELAGILAHEITHVTERHHLIAMNSAARAGLLTRVIGSQLKKELGSLVSSHLLALGRNVYTQGLSQQDEFDADRGGVALATRSGLEPYGLVAALQQLRSAAPDDALFALTFSTHPPAQTRLDQLEVAMGHGLDAYTGQPAVLVAQRLGQRTNAPAPKRKKK